MRSIKPFSPCLLEWATFNLKLLLEDITSKSSPKDQSNGTISSRALAIGKSPSKRSGSQTRLKTDGLLASEEVSLTVEHPLRSFQRSTMTD